MLGVAGLLLVAANAPWLTVALRGGGAVEVPGPAAAPALNGLALACVACVGAATLAPRPLRYVLASVLAVIGGAAAVLPIVVLADPVPAAEGSVSAVTGVSGHESVASLVGSVAPTPWPGIAVAGAVVLVVLAIAMAATARHWPGSRGTAADRPVDTAPSDPWDALSRGADPTRETGAGGAPLDSEP